MKCDLHVHTLHSGMCTVPVARRFCRESYAEPEAVYERLKRCGMDLVTITDHDSIGACEALRRHPDFFLSVEATCTMPSGSEVHIGIYDVTEQQHIEVQRRRDDFFSLIAYLSEQRLFFSINHLLSSLTGRRYLSDYKWFEAVFPAFETLNGAMSKRSNRLATQMALAMEKAPVAGSDAHTLASVGTAFTDVPEARTKAEFLAGLRAGRGVACGRSGGYTHVTKEIFSICLSLVKEKPVCASLAPIVSALPLVTLVNCCLEAAFAEWWYAATMRPRDTGSVGISGAEASA